jgi:hypothetical protein
MTPGSRSFERGLRWIWKDIDQLISSGLFALGVVVPSLRRDVIGRLQISAGTPGKD